jgi:hypothetical protein
LLSTPTVKGARPGAPPDGDDVAAANRMEHGLQRCHLQGRHRARRACSRGVRPKRRVWRTVPPKRRAAGLASTARFHDVRHTAASWLIRTVRPSRSPGAVRARVHRDHAGPVRPPGPAVQPGRRPPVDGRPAGQRDRGQRPAPAAAGPSRLEGRYVRHQDLSLARVVDLLPDWRETAVVQVHNVLVVRHGFGQVQPVIGLRMALSARFVDPLNASRPSMITNF